MTGSKRNSQHATGTNRSASRRSRATGGSAAKGPTAAAAELEARRTRQAAIATIIDNVFGPVAERVPGLLGHRTYLVIVESVHDRLGAGTDMVPTEDLVGLAQVLVRCRRGQSRAGTDPAPHELPPMLRTSDGRLPEFLAEVVRRIYGTCLPATDSERPAANGKQPVEEV